ncbi:MAG: TetR family transcriptional regulator C-terminal domain-containing protein [Lachnospiraceae bacterium]|nr:TetR family transcriptional regulator C-terminal domain-containing protein [Lachnospiraceae bacterium]
MPSGIALHRRFFCSPGRNYRTRCRSRWYFYNYITYGVYRVVCVWLNKEVRESPEAIAKLIDQMVME